MIEGVTNVDYGKMEMVSINRKGEIYREDVAVYDKKTWRYDAYGLQKIAGDNFIFIAVENRFMNFMKVKVD